MAKKEAVQTVPEASVLLIGSTGNGKSTLGNYLLDPHETRDCPTFETAKAGLPTTKVTESETKIIRNISKYPRIKLTVIDTPGLNEDCKEDVEHMVDLIKTLQKTGKITACIFVVRFRSTIDMQYKATIRYYSKLLPALFERNVFVVMTNYATDARSVFQREREGIDEKLLQRNVVSTIVECTGITYDNLMVFKIDCLPVMDDEKQYSLSTCWSIIDYIYSLKPVRMVTLQVAKTDYILAQDEGKIKEYEGSIVGYKEMLEQFKSEASDILNQVLHQEKKVTRLEAQIRSFNDELKEKDTDELVVAASWTIDEEWKWFSTQEEGYHIKSPWEICNVRKWTNGKCELRDQEQTTHSLKGKVIGSFMRGLYASIILETKKCFKYEKEIRQIEEKLKITGEEWSKESSILDKITGEYDDCIAEVENLKKFIEEKRQIILHLMSDKMSINEACERLQNML